MTIKEKPLIDAATNPDPLPNFLFAHPVLTGFFALIMCPVFGAVFMLFQVAGRGGVEALELFEAARVGTIVGAGVGAIILTGIAISAFREPDEKAFRLQFALGGLLAILILAVTDWLALDALRACFADAGPLV